MHTFTQYINLHFEEQNITTTIPNKISSNFLFFVCMGNKYSSLSEEQLAWIFKKHDIDRDRKLTKEELARAFDYLGSRWTARRVKGALRAVDANGDGVISMDEMSKLIVYVKGLRT
ncbi:putative calcium-binding protein CML10 [Cucumis melo var. makuwa]|uniref:Calcium-binding protein CML10 n=2 Tax=Cucumis melo TaxID=3656 RepID=A0A5A7V219_CUCMM|nr:putative calcium-binding protein CML10 [Cucumis melo var. makuwa]